MAHWNYDRLSALDASFLAIEDANAHMHIGSVALFDAEPVAGPHGGIDFERIERFIEGQLHKNARFRQKLAMIPRLDHPVWIDDHTFNIHYHLRHTALPAPGDVRQLKRLAGRIMSQQLDRGKPLWETWFVEGIEGNRFATITKVHHCLADGISGADLATATMGTDPDYAPSPGPPWAPRPVPSDARLLVDELSRRAWMPVEVLSAGARAIADFGASLESLRETAQSLAETATSFGGGTVTPLNEPIGPHRRFDWTRFELDAVKRLGKRADAKVNDVVLAVVSGALRSWFEGRGLDPAELDFRAMVPVSLRTEDERGTLGNRVSSLLARLPLDEADPRKRLRRVVETTRELKTSGQVKSGELLAQVMEASDALLQRFARAASESTAANIVVTNVPGPPMTAYLLGAPMLEVYPVVPLAPHQGLGVALFSYDGGLHWGFNADWDRVADLHDFAIAIATEFETLSKAVDSGA